MNRSTRWGAVAVAALGVLLFATEALAQGKAGGRRKRGTATSSPTIRSTPVASARTTRRSASVPGPVRTTLIRPRTSFVPEMLKSVENL